MEGLKLLRGMRELFEWIKLGLRVKYKGIEWYVLRLACENVVVAQLFEAKPCGQRVFNGAKEW